MATARFDNVPLDPKYEGYFKLPGTRTFLKIGGFFKTDFIYDLKPAGNTYLFIPSYSPFLAQLKACFYPTKVQHVAILEWPGLVRF